MKIANIKFIDLFSGLGGFNKALSDLGMTCVFACEIDKTLRQIYEKNYGIKPEGDIRLIDEHKIPEHDILCAGFPCQPFSLAGNRNGSKCTSSGKLIYDIIRIAKYHKPKYILLENVPSILTIDKGQFWQDIKQSLHNINYQIDYRILSPTDFGIPQNRKRIFVIAQHCSIKNKFLWPEKRQYNTQKSIYQFLNNSTDNIVPINYKKESVLTLWQQVINYIPEISSHSIIANEFGATYPLDNVNNITLSKIKQYKGAWGADLSKCSTWQEILHRLPYYINNNNKTPPAWLYPSIKYTRKLYYQNQSFFDKIKLNFRSLPQSWQKIQWQGFREPERCNIWQHIIQFRPSGIRVIKPIKIPCLVAMTPTQTPIIGCQKRYLTVKEAASLQGLDELKYLPSNTAFAFKALGNAVNSHVIKAIVPHKLHMIK